MTGLRRVVVVGNGIAGVTAADSLRAEGFDGEITLVGDEPRPAYSRPALSKALLRDHDDLTSHLLPPPTHGAVELRGVRATGLDVEERTVLLGDGDRLPYDGLVVASGCRPRRLGEDRADGSGGSDGVGELALRTLDDAWELRRRVADRPSVVVVGGGPLGMEIASGCLEVGCRVTLVSQGPPLARLLGTHLSAVFVEAARARGLDIVTAGATGLAPGDDGTRVILRDGSSIEGGLVVTAVGDHPNVEWLASSGLLRHGALVTDERSRVRPGIVAAGDVATVPTPHGLRRVPLWSAAIEHGRAAARALLGTDPPPHDDRPYFWTEQFGLSLKAVGHLPLRGEPAVVDGGPDGRALLRWDPTPDLPAGAAAAVNYRIPIPRLRRLCEAA